MRYAVIAIFVSSAVACATELLVGPIRLQRRNEVEHVQGAQNEPGELTYAVAEDGKATLRVGTETEGTIIVSDPVAVRYVPTRVLADEEWYVEYGDGVEAGPDRSIVFYDAHPAVTNGVNISRTATVRPVDEAVALASVTATPVVSVGHISIATAEAGSVITGIGWHSPEGMPMPISVEASNIIVRAYSSDERAATTDLRDNPIGLVDTLGPIQLGALREWVTNRYDAATAPAWSQHAATHPVRLDRQSIRWDSSGALIMRWQGDAASNGWAVTSHGWPILALTPGAGGGGETMEGFDIVQMVVGASSIVIHVADGIWGDVAIQQVSDPSFGEWIASAGQTSSYPATESVDGRDCVRIEIPTPEGDRWLFRAVATLPSQRTAVDWDYCDLRYSQRVRILHALQTPPASATDDGLPGEVRWGTNHVYLCVASNVWQRAELTTW